MKKTTLTISGASAYAEALLEDARISGRTILAIQADPDQRRSGSQAEARSGIQPAHLEAGQADRQPEAQPGAQPDPRANLQDGESSAESQSTIEPTEGPATRAEHTVINWNPGSFASTKAALIEAETALGGTVNEAILFIDPDSRDQRLSDMTLAQIDAATTTWISGYVQLLRELGRRFAERGTGLIVVVLLSGDRGPLGAMASGALEALACTLAARTGEAYRLFAVRDESSQPELLARYIMKILDEPPRDSAKLLRHGGRINLFGK